jgi:hypothetical protein
MMSFNRKTTGKRHSATTPLPCSTFLVRYSIFVKKIGILHVSLGEALAGIICNVLGYVFCEDIIIREPENEFPVR